MLARGKEYCFKLKRKEPIEKARYNELLHKKYILTNIWFFWPYYGQLPSTNNTAAVEGGSEKVAILKHYEIRGLILIDFY